MSAPPFEKLRPELSSLSCLVTDAKQLKEYQGDATPARGQPAALVLAACQDDVIATLNFCRAHEIPVSARGAGTGLSGGCVPIDGGLVLSTENIDNIEIDMASRVAFCGPGIINKALVDMAAPLGLTYPPDPASYAESTLGGNVAENAGGLRCLRYGVTRNYVIGLIAVSASGALIKTGIFADAAAFNVQDLLIGSEGTLAVITQIALRLTDLPSPGATILAAFDDPVDAANTVFAISSAGIRPTVLEYLDADAALCSNQYEKVDGLDNAGAILLIETSGENPKSQAEQVETICRHNNCAFIRTANNPEEIDTLWKVRRNLSKAIEAAAKFRLNEDVAVPISEFITLIKFVDELNQRGSLRVNAFGHAGDGNLHVSFLSTTGSETEQVEMEAGIEELLRKTIELGGTLSGEHGIGLAKRKHLHLEFDPPTLNAMKSIKDLFDPDRILNPDKIFTDC